MESFECQGEELRIISAFIYSLIYFFNVSNAYYVQSLDLGLSWEPLRILMKGVKR